MTVMSRQALFEAAWQRPLTEIAAGFGISDVGLRKICDRHDIPTPGRGYWAQVRAGKTFARPKLRPVSDPWKEEVHIVGGRPLPPVVVDAMRQAKALSATPPARKRGPAKPAEARPPEEPTKEDAAHIPAPAVGKALAATEKALAKARMDADGFSAVSGSGIIPMRIASASHAPALNFLAMLLGEADVRGWRLENEEGRPKLNIDGETIAFRIDEVADKTSHAPTPKELAEKARRDRWGGNTQPWPTWDLTPSGRLAFVIEENNLSGLRRTHSQRKGHTFESSLDNIVAGLAGHAAFKAERRREDEARARETAIAEARRKRLEAFERREARRAKFVGRVHDLLKEQRRLGAVLAHLEAQSAEHRSSLADMEAWLRRRLQSVGAKLDPVSLEVSARHSEVAFEEPPRKAEPAYWYPREIELRIWKPDVAEQVMRSVAELDWAIGQALIADPRAEPAADPNAVSETSD